MGIQVANDQEETPVIKAGPLSKDISIKQQQKWSKINDK